MIGKLDQNFFAYKKKNKIIYVSVFLFILFKPITLILCEKEIQDAKWVDLNHFFLVD